MPDEPEAALMQRPDKNLVGPVVTKRSSGAIDAAAERSLGDDPAIPDRLYQFILADNPVMVTHEVNDEIEHLWLDMDGLAKPAQLLLTEVDFELGKPVFNYHHYPYQCRSEARQPIKKFNDTNIAKTITSEGKTKIF
jgi:hypothetical protein